MGLHQELRTADHDGRRVLAGLGAGMSHVPLYHGYVTTYRVVLLEGPSKVRHVEHTGLTEKVAAGAVRAFNKTFDRHGIDATAIMEEEG